MLSVRHTLVSFAAFVLFASVATAQETRYTRMLLPVAPSSVEGANGARWLTELTVANTGLDPVELYCFEGETCQPIAPLSVHRVEAPPDTRAQPALVYVPETMSRRVSTALRSRNSTPNSDERDFVSEIPVVREEEFRSSGIDLTAVPIEANYRHMLRIYDANAREGATVRVRIYGMSNGRIATDALVDRRVTLNTSRGTAAPFARPDEPS